MYYILCFNKQHSNSYIVFFTIVNFLFSFFFFFVIIYLLAQCSASQTKSYGSLWQQAMEAVEHLRKTHSPIKCLGLSPQWGSTADGPIGQQTHPLKKFGNHWPTIQPTPCWCSWSRYGIVAVITWRRDRNPPFPRITSKLDNSNAYSTVPSVPGKCGLRMGMRPFSTYLLRIQDEMLLTQQSVWPEGSS